MGDLSPSGMGAEGQTAYCGIPEVVPGAFR